MAGRHLVVPADEGASASTDKRGRHAVGTEAAATHQDDRRPAESASHAFLDEGGVNDEELRVDPALRVGSDAEASTQLIVNMRAGAVELIRKERDFRYAQPWTNRQYVLRTGSQEPAYFFFFDLGFFFMRPPV